MKVYSLNVASPEKVIFNNKELVTSIFKKPVNTKLFLSKKGLENDKQADLTSHGGKYKALYGYSYEHYSYWGQFLEKDFSKEYGLVGENLTISTFDEKEVYIGDEYKIGDAIVKVSQPRIPCFKLGIKMNSRGFVKDFINSNKLGVYFQVIKEGYIKQDDDLEVLHRANHNVSIFNVSNLLFLDTTNYLEMKSLLDLKILSPEVEEKFQSRCVKAGIYDVL